MGRRVKIIKGIIRKKPGHWKFLCFHCLKSGKGPNPCGIQGHFIKMISHKIHFPSPTASKTRWKEFIKAVGLERWGSFREEKEWEIFIKSVNKR